MNSIAPRPRRTRWAVTLLAATLGVSTLAAQSVPGPQPDRESPELRTFGAQLFRNFKATFTSKENVLPLAVSVGATGVSSIWDDNVQGYFSDPGRGRELGNVGEWLGRPAVIGGIAGGTLLIGYGSNNDKLRRVGYDLSQSFILVEGLTNAFKHTVHRERPNGQDRLSFVSGHSSQSFAMAVVVAHHYRKAAVPAYLVASFVAFSRIIKDKHWLSDTVGGAAVGFIVARTVVRESGRLTVGRVELSPQIPPGGGVAVSASFKL